jgi:uncharacterized protein (TIGR03118 family)
MALLKFVQKFSGMIVLLSLLAPQALFGQHYIQTNLVASFPGVGTNATNPRDTDLINAWGLTRSVTSPWWVSDNGTGLSTIYNGAGTKQGLIVTVPVPMNQTAPSAPTGIVSNGTSDFKLANGNPARFIFVTEGGTIAGWNGGSTATIVVDHSKSDAVYKGCTIAELNGKHYLYVANFHSGEIEVYDGSFQRVRLQGNSFARDGDDDNDGRDHDRDSAFNGNPRHFAPFNVQAIGSNIYVAYAKQDAQRHDEEAGPGLGDVVVFDPSGRRLSRMQHGDWFNAPWGIAMAPGEFGEFSHALLVGMFGSGQIAAFNPLNGSFLGLMKASDDTPLGIDGLWALGFGAGNTNSGPYNTLFFTAGPNGEKDGLFGTLVPLAAELTEADEP